MLFGFGRLKRFRSHQDDGGTPARRIRSVGVELSITMGAEITVDRLPESILRSRQVRASCASRIDGPHRAGSYQATVQRKHRADPVLVPCKMGNQYESLRSRRLGGCNGYSRLPNSGAQDGKAYVA